MAKSDVPKFEEVPDLNTEAVHDFDTPAAARKTQHDHTIDEMPQPGAVKVDEKLLAPVLRLDPSEDIKRQIAAEDIKTPASSVSEPAIITG